METKDVAREFIAQLDMIHLSAVDNFFRVDCKFFLPGSHEAVDCDQFKSFVGMLYAAFPDLRHTIVEQIYRYCCHSLSRRQNCSVKRPIRCVKPSR